MHTFTLCYNPLHYFLMPLLLLFSFFSLSGTVHLIHYSIFSGSSTPLTLFTIMLPCEDVSFFLLPSHRQAGIARSSLLHQPLLLFSVKVKSTHLQTTKDVKKASSSGKCHIKKLFPAWFVILKKQVKSRRRTEKGECINGFLPLE